MLTALIQSVVGGIGFAVTGVPHAMLLTAIMFMLGVAQIGPAPMLLGGVIYLYWKGDSVWGTVMLVWFLVTTVLDNFVRPILIRKGADLPLLLILAGVLGGLFAFGIVGLFIGPVGATERRGDAVRSVGRRIGGCPGRALTPSPSADAYCGGGGGGGGAEGTQTHCHG